ncbi:uncharacterized protein [Anabrus simplex]|uniref:uncharacterized protein n=1 Tax=Anabrus simplex TaxID=316456 RepID=UPI0035A28D0A
MFLHLAFAFHALCLLFTVQTCWSACYFPIEYQGQFLMQSAVIAGPTVRYSQLNITAEAIPIWGHCHHRIGNNVILMDSSGGTDCIRCFHLNLRSRNVLQVHTEGLDKCYTNEDAAKATCPDEATLYGGDTSKEIILYKIKDANGDPIREEFCPINGRFRFSYQSADTLECSEAVSEMDNCPSDSALNLRFRDCNFHNYDMTYQCLGHWTGRNNQRYIALLNRGGERFPRYRCALYREDASTGVIFMAFSNDSTCRSDLHSATSGYEKLTLSTMPAPQWPEYVFASNCRFPAWALGHWQHLYVENKELTYKDHFTFKTFNMRCVGSDVGDGDRFLVFARTHCGEHMHNCIWMKKRGSNVIEFKLGQHTSTDLNTSLCSDSNFEGVTWITQGRLERKQEMPCPISGEYTGFLPDAPGLCARLSSDCRSPEIMYYTVSDCTQAEVYEEREYRCLGQWVEDGLMYTYTQRSDVGTYECFVGSIVSNDEIYIKEAGDHCQRNMNPFERGMKLTRKGSCVGDQRTSGSPQRPHPTSPWLSSKYPPEPTKPWKPITAPPRKPGGVQNAATLPARPLMMILGLTLLISRSL